jgi:ABC-type transport system substrate-binding protein
LALLLVAGAALASAAPTLAADASKVLRVAFPTGETGFDPARVTDLYSNAVNEAIFERLLTYDYLARPAKLVPMAAEAMPEVSDNGRTWVFRLRKGIRFAPDPAFGGKPRELTAEDFVYSYKRFLDPRNRSGWAFMLEGKIEGLDAVAAAGKRSGRFDYDAPVAGLQALDRYTLRIRLTTADYNFPYIAAHVPMAAVAREVVEAYGDELMAHPVGTGPYLLKEWTRSARIVLEANPEYRGFTWDFAASEPAWDDALVADMRGKRMPQAGRVEISILEEDQTRWLAFEGREIDVLNLPAPFRDKALAGDRIAPALAAQGVTMHRSVDPEITYTAFNMRDPLVGGFTREKIALRRAIAMAYDVDEEVRVVRKEQAIPLEMPIPPGVVGHDPGYRSSVRHDPALAERLLDRFGYRKGSDGWRTLPDGRPLVLRYATETGGVARELNELWQKSMDRIGVHIVFDVSKFADNLKAGKACKLMLWGQAWTADYPDGDNFMQLFYGPNTGQNNNGCYESKSFDALYAKSRAIPRSPERDRLFLEMTRQMEVDGANSLHIARVRSQLIRPWIKGFKKHPILQAEWMYVDVLPRS